MTAVTPVPFTTPDGVERQLRSTFGAQKLIAERYGVNKPLKDILNEHGDAAAMFILWAMMHDEEGNAPDISLRKLEFTIPQSSTTEVLAAIMSAYSQGKAPKNELEALITTLTDAMKKDQLQELITSGGGASQLSASDSVTPISGGGTRKRKSAPVPIATASTTDT